MTPNILLADDHSMIRKGLKLYLQVNLKYEQVSETDSCASLMKELLKKQYTHLVIDIIFTDGNSLEIIPNITKIYKDLKIMVFSMQPPEVYGKALKQYGISYYLSKTEDEETIIEALRKFMEDKPLNEEEIQQNFVKDNPFASLAPRELEILHYLLKGMGTKQVSESLNLKMNTISTLKGRIFEKTNTTNLKDLIELAAIYNLNY